MSEHVSSEQEPKKPWAEPAIVLERPILVAAQDATPDPGARRPGRIRDNGLISPMSNSGGNSECLPGG